MSAKKTIALLGLCGALLVGQNADAQRRRRKGRIKINSIPRAKVYMKGALKGHTPLKLNAPPGRHRIVLKASGRKTVSVTVRVRSNRTTVVSKRLPPKRMPRGSLAVRATPRSKVYIDGKYVGKTPQLNMKFRAGKHRVKLVAPDGRTWNRWVRLRPGNPQRIKHRFPPRVSYIRVNATPRAKVYLDGKYIGTTPIARKKVKPGRHTIKLRKPGFFSVTTGYVAQPGRTKTISKRLRRRPRFGFVQINSRPVAKVYMDGKFIGNTPIARKKLRPGTHKVTLRKPGFHPKSQTFTVRAGRKQKIVVALKKRRPRHGWLIIQSHPRAKVFLNGRFVGRSPIKRLKAKPGRHRLRFKGPRGYRKRMTVRVRAGRGTRVNVRLVR